MNEERQPITEEWLSSVGFKWHQIDRQPEKQWLLWLGDCLVEEDAKRRMFTSFEDIGIELCSGAGIDSNDLWFCWFRSDMAGRYHRFIHIRHLKYQDELISLIEAITGQRWNPENNLWGSMRTPDQAARIRKECARLDLKYRQTAKWHEAEKDDTRSRALPEHLDEAIKAGKAK